MICVDTSVWVAALRARDSIAGRRLDILLDGDEWPCRSPCVWNS